LSIKGQDPPSLRSDSPSSVLVTWNPPATSNGVLDNYVLERRSDGKERDR